MSAAAGAAPTTLQDVAGLPAADQSLPILQGVLNRSTYRSRPEEEVEEATWYSPDEPDTLVEPQQVHLKSIHSKQSSVIVFSNKTPYRVRALWLDFKGDEVVYSVLEPNSTKRYHTYITHPWLVREVTSGTRMLLSGRPAVVGTSTEQVVEVQAPPELRWSLDTHSCFPSPFKAAVRALLLSHKDLERITAAAPAAAATPTAAPRDPTSPSFKRLACSSPAHAATATLDAPATPLSPRSSALVSLVMAAAPAPAACDHPDAAAAAAAWPCSPRAAGRRQLLPVCLSPGARAPPGGIVPVAASPRRAPSPAGACYGAGSSAAAGGGSSSTTSISITTEAANFTLTVTSPKRSSSSALKSMTSLNIAFNTSSVGGAGTTTTAMINLDTVLGGGAPAAAGGGGPGVAGAAGGAMDEAACMAIDGCSGDPDSSGCRSRKKAARGLFNNLMSNFKALMKPRPAACDAASPATHITLEVSHSPEPHTSHGSTSSMMDVDGCCWAEAVAKDAVPWAHAGTHLGHLPSHLLARIAELAAPTVYQSALMPAKGKPDILPVLMASAPQQEEQQQEDGEDVDEIPPLI